MLQFLFLLVNDGQLGFQVLFYRFCFQFFALDFLLALVQHQFALFQLVFRLLYLLVTERYFFLQIGFLVQEFFLYFLRNYGVLLAVSVVCCTPLIEKLWKLLSRNAITKVLTILVLLTVSMAYVVGSTNSPFLYFNF